MTMLVLQIITITEAVLQLGLESVGLRGSQPEGGKPAVSGRVWALPYGQCVATVPHLI